MTSLAFEETRSRLATNPAHLAGQPPFMSNPEPNPNRSKFVPKRPPGKIDSSAPSPASASASAAPSTAKAGSGSAPGSGSGSGSGSSSAGSSVPSKAGAPRKRSRLRRFLALGRDIRDNVRDQVKPRQKGALKTLLRAVGALVVLFVVAGLVGFAVFTLPELNRNRILKNEREAMLAEFRQSAGEGRFGEAWPLLEKFLEDHPGDFPSLNEAYRTLGIPEAAPVAADAPARPASEPLAPEDPEAAIRPRALASELEPGVRLLVNGLNLHPAQHNWRHRVVLWSAALGDFERAAEQTEWLCRSSSANPGHVADALRALDAMPESVVRLVRKANLVRAGLAPNANPRSPALLRRNLALRLAMGATADLDKDLEAYGNALGSERDKEIEYQILAGRVAAARKNYDLAARNLERANAMDPQRMDAHAARLAAILEDPARGRLAAREQLERLVRERPEDHRVHVLAANFHGDLDKAAREVALRRAEELAPDARDTLIARAIALAEDAEERQRRQSRVGSASGTPGDPGEDPESPDQRLAQLLARARGLYPDEPWFQVLEAQRLARGERLEDAARTLRSFLERLPDEIFARQTLVELLCDLNRPDDAARALVDWPDAPFAEPTREILEIRVLMARRRFNEAVSKLDALLPNLAQQPELAVRALNLLATSHAALGNPNEERKALDLALKFGGDPAVIAARRGRSLVLEGQLGAAVEQLSRAAPDFARAKVSLASVKILETIVSPPGRRDWASVERLVADAERENPGAAEPPLLRAQILLARNQWDEALAVLQPLQARFPENAEAWALAALAEFRRQPGSEGLTRARGVLQRLDQSPLSESQKLFVRTRAWGLVPDPAAGQILESLLSRFEALGPEVKRARALADNTPVDEAPRPGEGESGGESELDLDLLARAQAQLLDVALAVGGPGLARGAIERLLRAELDDPAMRPVALRVALLADAPELVGLLEDSARKLEGGSGVWPRIYRVARDLLAARRARAGNPGSAPSPETLASLQSAMEQLASVESARPDWMIVPFLRAEIALFRNDDETAVRELRRARELPGGRVPATQALILVHARRGRWGDVDLAIRELEAKAQIPGTLRLVALEAAIRANNVQRANALADVLIADGVERGSIDGALLVAQARELGNRLEEAGKILGGAHARALTPPGPAQRPAELLATAAALARFHARNRRLEDARSAIEQALAAIEPPGAEIVPYLPLYRARAAVLLEDLAAAEVLYRQALQTLPNPNEANAPPPPAYLEGSRDAALLESIDVALARGGIERLRDAVGQLQKALESATTASAETPEFRRRLALLSLQLPENNADPAARDAALRRSLALVDQNLRENPDSARDRVRKAILLANRGESRPEAIAILTNLSSEELGASPPRDQLMAARILESAAEWPAARGILAGLAEAQGPSASLLLEAGEVALVRNETGLAEKLLARVPQPAAIGANGASRAPADAGAPLDLDARIVLARARLAKQRNQPNELRDARGQLAKRLHPLVLAAVETEFGNLPAAEALYRRLAEEERRSAAGAAGGGQGPGYAARLQLLAFLANIKKPEEAPGLLTELAEIAPPDQVARALAGVAGSGGLPANLNARLDAWVSDRLRRHPDQPIWLLPLATLADERGELDRAIELYRRLVGAAPGDLEFRNNLAYLLALRGTGPDAEEALGLINGVLAANQRVSTFLDTRAVVHLAQGRVNDAVNDLKRALEDRESKFARYHLARALSLSQRDDEARANIEQAIRGGLVETDLHPLERPNFQSLKP